MTRNEYAKLSESIAWNRARQTVLELDFIPADVAIRITAKMREAEKRSTQEDLKRIDRASERLAEDIANVS